MITFPPIFTSSSFYFLFQSLVRPYVSGPNHVKVMTSVADLEAKGVPIQKVTFYHDSSYSLYILASSLTYCDDDCNQTLLLY